MGKQFKKKVFWGSATGVNPTKLWFSELSNFLLLGSSVYYGNMGKMYIYYETSKKTEKKLKLRKKVW